MLPHLAGESESNAYRRHRRRGGESPDAAPQRCILAVLLNERVQLKKPSEAHPPGQGVLSGMNRMSEESIFPRKRRERHAVYRQVASPVERGIKIHRLAP